MPGDGVDEHSSEGLLDVDPITCLRARCVTHDEHRGVHVRGFEQIEPTPREVEGTATVIERTDAVTRPATDHHERTITSNRGVSLSGDRAC